jgi:SNF2 family DNA or RNA helicase
VLLLLRKSKTSRLFQVLHDFDTRQRTLLTGTPLQNNLDELFILMHFLEPEKFSSLEAFQVFPDKPNNRK